MPNIESPRENILIRKVHKRDSTLNLKRLSQIKVLGQPVKGVVKLIAEHVMPAKSPCTADETLRIQKPISWILELYGLFVYGFY